MQMPNAQRGQKPISSFFTKAQPQAQALEKQSVKSVSLSMPVDDSTDSRDDLKLPDSKRARRNSPTTDATIDPPIRERPLVAISPNKQGSTNRTSQYLFASSSQPENLSQQAVSSQELQQKERLHDRFVKKLGKPDSIVELKRRSRAIFEDNNGVEEDADHEAPEEGSPPPKGKKGAGSKRSSNKLTPMEKQVLEMKRAHMDTILVVEVGYKFRFFGEDARVAAKELSIVCIPGKFRYDEHPSEAHLDRFASASIPVHRLHVHVKRLVAAGHKVGVVRQLETAALKAAGDNRNAPFVRKLSNLYTKGTYIDDEQGVEEPNAGSTAAPGTGFLLCLTEANAKGWGNDEKVQVGIIAVQPATGDIVYDDFEDGFMRAEIETRLLHIAPCEFLIVGEPSKATEKLIQHLSGSKINVFGDKIRVERVARQKTMVAQAFSHISAFYANRMKERHSNDDRGRNLLEKVLNLPENVSVCLSAMMVHMQEYGLEHVFDLTKYFQPFAARSHMLLNGNTLSSLEIYQNQTDHTAKGSLFWTLDRTLTKFGQRLLRKWVGRPLLGRQKIEERLAAVEELLDTEKSAKVEQLKRLLSRTKIDLEKSLIRIYYGKCTRPELLNVLQSLQVIASEVAHVGSPASTGFSSSLISNAVLVLPSILAEVVHYLEKINLDAAKSNDKYAFFREDQETDAIAEHKFGIASVEQDLDAFRSTAAEKIGKKNAVEYVTVAGIEYLIEVSNSSGLIKKVPASWIKVSGTKANSRFHPPEIINLMRERDQHRESLAAACDDAFKALLAELSSKYELFRDCVQNLATLDCVLSLSTIAQQPGYVRPSFVDETAIDVEGARHPMVEQLLLDAYVPNSIQLSHKSTRALLITGPNMGGKSSYVRSVALICIMAQIGCHVPASSARLGLLDAILTRMGAFDNMLSGESTFMVELAETSDILKLASPRSLVILDELGRGTSTHDGVAIAQAVLDYMVRDSQALTLFITHYQTLATVADGFLNGELKNVHMRFAEHEESDEITFLYEVGDGTAHRSYGLNVARLANIPANVIEVSRAMSRDMENEMKMKKVKALTRMLGQSVLKDEETGNGQVGDSALAGRIESIVEGIQQL